MIHFCRKFPLPTPAFGCYRCSSLASLALTRVAWGIVYLPLIFGAKFCKWKEKSWKNEGQESEAITSVFEQGSNLNQIVYDFGFQVPNVHFQGKKSLGCKNRHQRLYGGRFYCFHHQAFSSKTTVPPLETAGANIQLDQVLFPQVYQTAGKTMGFQTWKSPTFRRWEPPSLHFGRLQNWEFWSKIQK